MLLVFNLLYTYSHRFIYVGEKWHSKFQSGGNCSEAQDGLIHCSRVMFILANRIGYNTKMTREHECKISSCLVGREVNICSGSAQEKKWRHEKWR
jgi:hypothetical protein